MSVLLLVSFVVAFISNANLRPKSSHINSYNYNNKKSIFIIVNLEVW